MKMEIKKVIFMALALLFGTNASAQLVAETNMNQATDQSQGKYQPMNMSYAGFGSIGMTQSAWLDPLQNLGEGQSKPAYSKYYWSPDLVLPIRLREGMMTVINFPEWELIELIKAGDTTAIAGEIVGPNTVLLFPPQGTTVGVDTNVIIFGRSGNKYVFYAKTETVNTERLTNSIIDIDVVGNAGTSGGSPSSSSGTISGGSSRVSANGITSTGNKTLDASFTRRFLKEDWLKSIPMDPSKFRFDIEIYVPNPDDVVIAPERVWHDDIFTYIDLGEKALNMVQRPVVALIVERTETPVGFRTKGPNNRLIIVEGVGDMVMRNGKRMVCLKMRRSDEEGLQYVTYAENDNDWDIGPKIPDQNSNSGSAISSSSNALGSANYTSNSGASSGEMHDGASEGMLVNGVYVGGTANGIDYDKMQQINCSQDGSVKNPYPQYKYGTGFGDSNSESLSIELGVDDNVKNLESLWHDLSGKYSSLLSGYEPFYSVDTPADGQGKELFHLRVGPIKNLDSGDSVCSQLGRSGVFCSVVRVQ